MFRYFLFVGFAPFHSSMSPSRPPVTGHSDVLTKESNILTSKTTALPRLKSPSGDIHFFVILLVREYLFVGKALALQGKENWFKGDVYTCKDSDCIVFNAHKRFLYAEIGAFGYDVSCIQALIGKGVCLFSRICPSFRAAEYGNPYVMKL